MPVESTRETNRTRRGSDSLRLWFSGWAPVCLCSLCYRFSCVPSVALTDYDQNLPKNARPGPRFCQAGLGRAHLRPQQARNWAMQSACRSLLGSPLLPPVVESPHHTTFLAWFLTLRMYFYIAAIGQRGLASSWLVLAARMSRTAEDNRAAGVELCHDTKS